MLFQHLKNLILILECLVLKILSTHDTTQHCLLPESAEANQRLKKLIFFWKKIVLFYFNDNFSNCKPLDNYLDAYIKVFATSFGSRVKFKYEVIY